MCWHPYQSRLSAVFHVTDELDIAFTESNQYFHPPKCDCSYNVHSACVVPFTLEASSIIMPRTFRFSSLFIALLLLITTIPQVFAANPQLTVGDVSIAEGNSGLTALEFPLSFDSPLPSNTCFMAIYSIGSIDDLDGTGPFHPAGSDIPYSFCLDAGSTGATMSYSIFGDVLVEPDEFLGVQIVSTSPALDMVDDAGIGWILNDDGIGVGPLVHTDGTCSGAAVDNQIGVGEYQIVQRGTNSGFGNVIGKDALLYWNTDGAAGLQLALQKGPGDLNDAAVIYIDSIDGGFTSTASFTDEADPLRAAISGQGTSSSDSSVLTFASGFKPDFAIAFDATYAGLWQLVSGGSHTLIKGLGIQPASTSQSVYELGAALAPYTPLSLSDIGLAQGGTFKFLATYLNSDNAFRSDEFIGAAETTANSGNIGSNPFTMADGDFSTVSTFATPEFTIASNGLFYYEGESPVITLSHRTTGGALRTLDCGSVYLYDFSGTAVEGIDYTSDASNPDPLTFQDGQTQRKLTLTTIDDTDVEGDENFVVEFVSVSLGDPSPEELDRPLLDNDVIITISAGQNGPDVTEGQQYEFLVELSQIAPYPITVQVNPTLGGPGTAEPVDDFPIDIISVLIPAGEMFAQKDITIPNDDIYEGTESFSLQLQGPTVGSIIGFPSELIVNILDDEAVPVVSASDVMVAEGGPALLSDATVTLSLSVKSEHDIYVDITPQDDEAEAADADFVPGTQTVLIDSLELNVLATFIVNGDDKYEDDEDFSVVLSPSATPSGAVTIGDGTGVITILNDDALPAISIADTSATEGTTVPATDGTLNLVVSLTNPSENTTTVKVLTTDGTATLDDLDYSGLLDFVVTFVPGDISETLNLSIRQDSKYEADETFTATLYEPSGGTIGTGSATYTILNDDLAPALIIDGADVTEGDTGLTDPGHAVMQFTFSLDAESGVPVTFNWAAVSGGTSPATADIDFLLTGSSGSITIPAGSLNANAFVDVIGETMFEDDETFGVEVTSLTGATVPGANPAFAAILNDDDVPTLTLVPVGAAVEPVGITELDGTNNVTVTFEAQLSNPTEETVSFDLRTTDGTATRPDDYNTFFTNPETITAGTDMRSFSFVVRGDNIYETDEDFTIDLINVTNATAGDVLIDYQILDNDPIPTVSITTANEPEGDTGATNLEYEIFLSNPSKFTISVNAETVDGTATIAASDYVANSGVVEFTPGSVVVPFNIVVNGDTSLEPDETVGVQLSHMAVPSVVTIGVPNPAFGSILNDDSAANAIDNGGFEGGGGRAFNLDPWVITYSPATRKDDKVRCTPQHSDAKPNTGLCSLRFKGGSGESTSIKQVMQQQVRGFDALEPGLEYALGYYRQSGASGVLKLTVKVTSAGDIAGPVTEKFSETVRGSTGGLFVSEELDLGILPLGVTKVRVTFTHKSPSGKLYLDDVTLLPTTGPRGASPLPAPAAPSGWNGI